MFDWMNDPRVATYFWVILAMAGYAGYSRSSRRFLATRKELETYDRRIRWAFYLVLSIPAFFLAIWADQTLWNLIAPVFNWPMLDLLTAGALGTLILSLIWSTAGIRTVRVQDDREEF